MLRRAIVALVVFTFTIAAYADLQNVEVNGEIRIRGRANLNYQNGPSGLVDRIPLVADTMRPLGPGGFRSRYRFDDTGHDNHFAEIQTILGVTGDFTNDVKAVIELESYEVWGESFRSDYVTGTDTRAAGTGVEVLQGYIEANEMFGYPVRGRIGRQEMIYGKGFLAGDRPSGVTSLSFDAIRLTYAENDFTVDAWCSKLAENSPAEEDGDIDFYGVYGTYKGIEHLSASLYWMYVRDAEEQHDTRLNPLDEWTEDLFDLDDYDPTQMHTVGVRLWGDCSGFDYDLEAAYQFGVADTLGARFPLERIYGVYGDDDTEYDAWAADLEVGYTFGVKWSPRVYIGGAYFGGEDNRDVDAWQWLNPFSRSQASVSFNRLFAQVSSKYSFIVDGGQVLSNFSDLRLGLDFQPTEKLDLTFELEKFWVNETAELPYVLHIPVGRELMPVFQLPGFMTREASDDLGLQTTIAGRYNYTEDLWIKVQWEHLFAGDAIKDGSFTDHLGTSFLAGSDDDEADYVECTVGIAF